MSEKIQSMSSQTVRIKREYIRSYTDWVHPYDEEGDMILDKQIEKTIYEIVDDEGRIIYEHIDEPISDLFNVTHDFCGIDLRPHLQGKEPYEVNTNDMKHLLKLKPHGNMTSEFYAYHEAKYFEVVTSVTIWVKDENFYKNKYR